MVAKARRRPYACSVPRRAATLSLAAAIAAVLTGCAAGRSSPPPSGRAVFAGECSTCHTLSGRYDPSRQGGDLLRFRARRSQLRQFVREMPVRRPLTEAQLQAVVSYVMAAERRAGGEGRGAQRAGGR